MEKQSKTEGNNTKWKILIDGDKKYIEDLIGVFKTLKFEPKIYEEEGNFYLEDKIFDDTDNAQRIVSIANTFLTIAPAIPHFKSERAIEPPKVVVISYEDGNFKYVYGREGQLLCKAPIGDIVLEIQDMVHGSVIESLDFIQTSKDGQIVGGLNTIESIRNYLKTHSDSESLKNVAEYLKPFLENLVKYSNDYSDDKMTEEISEVLRSLEAKTKTLNWVNLYKIYELIERAVGNENKLKEKNWISEEQIDSFCATNNYFYRHSIFKVFEKTPKKRKMELYEAEEMISQLLSKYIEEKVKGGKP